jgi:triosephosphate isomerase
VAERQAAARKPLVSGNWKMNLNHLEAIQAVQKLAFRLGPQDYSRTDVSLHPPFTDLRSIQTLLDSDDIPISLGAQDCHWEDKGAFTGEVSPAMLEKLNVAYVIVGHSERRHLFGETDEMVSKKLRAVLRHGMSPILCVGDTLEEHDSGVAAERVGSQLRAALEGLGAGEREGIPSMVVAYEPVWAIGTGRNANPSDAQEMCARIRALLGELFGPGAAGAVRVQYGGSVNASNTPDFTAQPDIDGVLVGGASLDPDTFALIVQGKREATLRRS